MSKSRIECFLIVLTDTAQESLRRYAGRAPDAKQAQCPGPLGYHDASVPLGTLSWTGGDYLGYGAAEAVTQDQPVAAGFIALMSLSFVMGLHVAWPARRPPALPRVQDQDRIQEEELPEAQAYTEVEAFSPDR